MRTSDVRVIELPSGAHFQRPSERLQVFCAEEYDYYDAIRSDAPNAVEPVDVLVTVAVNSFITSAVQARSIHRELAKACNPILSTIPEDAELLTFDPDLEVVGQLLHAACSVRGALAPVATKVLHRKRRNLIPMLDTIVIIYYLKALGRTDLAAASQDKARAGSVARVVLRAFREDLRASAPDVGAVTRTLADAGYPLTPVRILEILLWTELEPRGYYR